MAYVTSNHNLDFSVTTLATSITVSSGDWIVVFVSWLSTTATASVADDKGNSYTARHNPTTVGSGRAAAFYAKAGSGGSTTITATISASATTTIHAFAFSGRDTTSAFDGSAAHTQVNAPSGTDAITSTAIVPTVDGADLVGFSVDLGSTAAITVGTGWTTHETADYYAGETKVQSTAASIAATFTRTTTSQDCATFIVALKPTGGASTPNVSSYLRTTQPLFIDSVISV